MKKIICLFLLLFFNRSELHAQDRTVQGIVFDLNSKQRLTRVYIYNTRTGEGFYNTTKGEFKTIVHDGDVLVAALQGYGVDTVSIRSENTVLFYLKRNSIQLQEVVVRDSVKSPANQLKARQEEFNTAYSKGRVGDIFTTGGSNGGGGAGLSINALYSLLSREGRNARLLQKIIERDYRDAIIDYRFTNSLINRVTGLNGEQLKDFKQQYKPGYYFIIEANDYDLIEFIRKSYANYLENPAAYRLQPLKGY
ncbi:MAG: carboxypeptidase-like regulatory domain-containing protein [Bacteroidetes bacterium]|nr:carboxypeptidase-like regulatory domain-containing protein [Bacteroidota bacterium]